MVVLEKPGSIQWLDVNTGKSGPWLRREVLTRSEQGMLGLAFHPKFKANGRFFLNYSVDVSGQKTTRVAEWAVEPGNPIADTQPREVRTIIEVAQPYANHNAGQLAFGPDGMLYIGLGDGGAANDPHGHGQNLGTLLGSMLRLDIDRAEPYAIPADNPFVGREGARGEIWAYGLRNPWRYSFAPDGRLVVADVGQNAFEEITIVGRGENHGWKVREAAHCFPGGERCHGDTVYTDPVWEYPRNEGISVTGGYVYTGKSIPALVGRYVFGDYGSGRLWALALPQAKSLQPDSAIRALGGFDVTPATFGVDHAGEMYVADFARGRIYRFSDD
jgi:glucose/arabinose dehydrogenase